MANQFAMLAVLVIFGRREWVALSSPAGELEGTSGRG